MSLALGNETAAQAVPTNDSEATSVNAPDIDPKTLKIQKRAISTIDQIYRICDAMFNPSSERNTVNGLIADKYNDGQPFDQKALEDSGQDWRHNFPTGFMSGIINQIVAQPVKVIDSAQFLTSAKLDPKDDPDGSLTAAFREEITTTIRNWTRWRTHIYNVAQEVVTFGFAASVCLDEDDWRPQEFRQDEFGVPDGCLQHSTNAQFIGLKREFMPDELFKKIEDGEKVAEDAGWNPDSVVYQINHAIPEQPSADGKGMTPRQYADLVRDLNSGMAHDPKSRTVNCYEILSKEADGKVSHYLIVRRGGGEGKTEDRGSADQADGDRRLLLEVEDQFEKMEDCLTLYTLEPGNGKLYGSKGLGRKLINIHLAVERTRNRAADQMYLGSMMWYKSEKGLPNIQFKVAHPFGIIGTEADLEANALPDNIEPFLKLDERLTAFAEQTAGAYIPEKLGEHGPDKTATEASIEANRQMTTMQDFLQRFFGQFAEEITMISRRLCKKGTSDEIAKAMQKRLEERGVTRELLDKLMEQPAAQVIQDLASQLTQAQVQSGQWLLQTANPFADKFKVTKMLVTSQAGKDYADSVLFQNGIDPTDEAINMRQQIMENAAIRTGESLPAVDTDNHKVHLDVIVSDLKQSAPGIEQQVSQRTLHPAILDNLNAVRAHAEDHITKWTAQATASKNQGDLQLIQTYVQFFDQMEQLIVKAAEFLKSQPQGQPPQGQPQPQPQGQPGQPGQADPNAAGPQMGALQIKASETIPYDKAPPQIQRQLEAMFGLTPAFGATAQNQWGGPTGGQGTTLPSNEELTASASPTTTTAPGQNGQGSPSNPPTAS